MRFALARVAKLPARVLERRFSAESESSRGSVSDRGFFLFNFREDQEVRVLIFRTLASDKLRLDSGVKMPEEHEKGKETAPQAAAAELGSTIFASLLIYTCP